MAILNLWGKTPLPTTNQVHRYELYPPKPARFWPCILNPAKTTVLCGLGLSPAPLALGARRRRRA